MNNDRNKNIEEILGSFDGSKKAAAPDFFYTRLKARMENEILPAPKKSWLVRPAFALTALAAVIAINAAVLLKADGNKKVADTETIQSIASEYSLNDNGYLYDINQDK